MSGIPIAVQLYTLREETEKDFAGTLKKVAELGFDGVEFAGFGGLSAEKVKELTDDLNLAPVSAHIPLADLKDNLDNVISDLKTVGIQYAVCPFLMPDQRTEENYQSLIPLLNEAGRKLKDAGITLCYHNHDFELERLSDGRMALEAIFDDSDPELLQTELDVYWLAKAKEDPAAWIKRYKGRSPLVHLKDMTKDEEQFFAELGTGSIDLEEILSLGDEAGVKWWVVEQDATRLTPFESIEISIKYLKKQLSIKGV
ncbi:sugar phosphate isomerase/epimerase [Bacillus infantis]|uniref:Sugar phosphate isomerase/epimerase n=1 Tax=Bacillus infantis TaxID=324767 RepID=A0A5D4SPD6_9BACI|nr:sugar phosphate isomerase/epimerase [Bacillus infantis]MCK6208723.1 sugar phosphate isomerase/epimerase [Bacillus infantis]TYS64809.1 sugar phosphate isomerase/epimerase [Bacillus infantis]